MLIYINGVFYPREKAVVSVFDHGFLYGDGIYETLRSYSGVVFKVREHAERLFRSAEKLSLSLPFDVEGVVGAVNGTLMENGLSDAYVRVTVSRGPGELGLDPALCPVPTVVIMARELAGYPQEMYEQGIKVSLVRTRRNLPAALDPSIKSTNFLNNILAKIEAKEAGAYEGIMLNHEGYVAEGTISNIFMVRGGRLVTPPAEAGILMGVTRQLVIRLAEAGGIPVEESLFTAGELMEADEVFITNTTMEVMPVTDIDGKKVADGVAGVVARKLLAAYGEEVRLCLRTR